MDVLVIIMGVIAVVVGVVGFISEHGGANAEQNEDVTDKAK